jgi:hypothetical protein
MNQWGRTEVVMNCFDVFYIYFEILRRNNIILPPVLNSLAPPVSFRFYDQYFLYFFLLHNMCYMLQPAHSA